MFLKGIMWAIGMIMLVVGTAFLLGTLALANIFVSNNHDGIAGNDPGMVEVLLIIIFGIIACAVLYAGSLLVRSFPKLTAGTIMMAGALIASAAIIFGEPLYLVPRITFTLVGIALVVMGVNWLQEIKAEHLSPLR